MIYLDNNATTAVAPEVLEAMRPHFLSPGNAESRHSAGRAARRAWDQARESTAAILGATPSEVIFTSGGTEANNLAIFGLAGAETSPGHAVSSPLEHPAVAEPLARLEVAGFRVDRPGVDSQGLADPGRMAETFCDSTRFATLMLANNETGTIEPVEKLVELANERSIPVHTDAVQAVGRIPVGFHSLGTATLAASAHKFHGPVGVGVLLVRSGIKLGSRLFGGGQQQGRRPGTVAVPLAVGFARALELWNAQADERTTRWKMLCERLEQELIKALGHDRVILNGPREPNARLPQTLNLGFPNIDGDALLIKLDLEGIAVSLGSACASGSTRPSPTLLAMKVPDDRLRSSVRISLGAMTTIDEIDRALPKIVASLKCIASQ